MRRKLIHALLAIGGVIAVGPSLLLALGPAPYPQGPVTFESYQFDPATVRPGEKSVYRFSWNGIDAARAVFEISKDPKKAGRICARADAETVGAAALLYLAQDWVSSCMMPETLQPEVYNIQIRESLDYYDMNVRFNHEQGAAERVKKRLTRTTERSFEFTNAFCPMSAAMLIRSLPWKPGDQRSFEVVDGNERYLLVVEAAEEGEVTVPAGTFKAIRIQPSIFELPGERARETKRYFERQKMKDQKRTADMTSFTLWMAADPPRPFLKARSDVYFGHVDMELMEFHAPPGPP
ncbi:MAG TPA: DUF3108 domain-containing protein [bacterium]|nr:DUF3108 domain-containing protein [bacterium]